ncbi:hypothetical protein CNMCM6805_005281 [Aspergillus fumigatiaffinis]|uniref:Choline/ethanolamine kinase n=1 Tax=Aspergillus fumigatiaffinis TaxID=340414 RepID=A0A8H4GPZ6_9EURO|nr:hypothetical protein CNMCM6805_005281 [Aspergillus fumigatiaffinis]
MATAISVPVTLPEDKVPTTKDVRDIIGAFLTEEWPSVEPETLTVSYHASFVNAHRPVERPKPDTATSTEPLVFIKLHNDTSGGLEIFEPLVPTKHEEALFCYEYGQTGLGAKVYGFFKTQDGTLGRVEEFLDARNMELEDVEDSVIRADVAKGLAIFHVMKTSLEKRRVESYYEAVINGLGNYHKAEMLKALGKEGGVMIDNLVNYDFGKRLRSVVDKLASVVRKTGWCIHDVQFMNVMVKNDPREGESKVVLIDFEFVMQNYRAFDIGGHFMQKMFKWFDEESKIAKCRKYTEKEKKHFCDEYARQWNQLTGDSQSRPGRLRFLDHVESDDGATVNDRPFKSLTTASFPLSAAQDNGVRPRESFVSTSTAPVSSSIFTTASCPFCAAKDNGVRLSESLESTSANPVAINSFTTASWPLLAALDSGVTPQESIEFISTRLVASNSFTTPSCPFQAALANAVEPSESLASTSTFPVPSNNFTTPSRPSLATQEYPFAANNNGVRP